MYEFSPIRFALESLLAPVAYGLIIAVLFSGLVRLIWKRPGLWTVLIYYASFSFPVGLVAFSAGLLTGLSRASAVGSILPASLALIAGLNVYIFGIESRFKLIVGYCIVVFVFMLFLGIETGSFQRESRREAYLIYLSEQEFRIRNFRSNLNLPPEMPSWMFGSDLK
jgi:hypothetical protein